MENLINKYGNHYGMNLFLLGYSYNQKHEGYIAKMIENGYSPIEIVNKLK